MDWTSVAGLGAVPVIVALVALARAEGLPASLAPVAAVVFGMGWNVALTPLVPGGVYPLLLQGVLAGLSAAGLYDVGKMGMRVVDAVARGTQEVTND